MAGDAAAGNVMVGIGENYFPAFVLALTASHVASGLVQTVPLMVGAVLQLAAPWLLRKFGSYRRWVVLCVAIQATGLLPLVATALGTRLPIGVVFALTSIYWATGMATSPAWNTWAGTLVPHRIRARYFALRSLICQAGTLVGFLGGGITLQIWTKLDARLMAFGLLFWVAAAARFVSVHFLSRQGDPVSPGGEPLSLRWTDLRALFTAHGNAKTLLYLLAAQAAVQISGPYFTPYMLGQLEFSYLQYALLIATAYLTKIICLSGLGRLARRLGATKLLWLGGAAIVPVSGLWLFSTSFYYLILAQMFSGAAWAVYELAMFLLFFETIPPAKRVNVMTVFNLANAAAIVAGSMFGGSVLLVIGENQAAYLTLFLTSTLARAAALTLMARVRKPAVRPVLRPRFTWSRTVAATGEPAVAVSRRTAPQPLSVPEAACLVRRAEFIAAEQEVPAVSTSA